MTPLSTLDPEPFQKLLADAFVVQQSGMDTQSLSAIVELQRSIAMNEGDVDRGMHLIADRARNVAQATGVAIALLTGDQLVYRAGSGSAATYVGRRVMAILSVSARNQARGEILRVENTQADTRIEAAICRQFGAKSLLILPIYRQHAVAGVLEVLFSEAHVFQEREVRTYRSMAGLAADVMGHSAKLEREKAPAAVQATNRRDIEQITPRIVNVLSDVGSASGATSKPATCQGCGASLADDPGLPALRHPSWAASMIRQRAKRLTLYKHRWKTAVAAVLLIASCLAYRDRRRESRLTASTLQRSNVVEQPVPFVPAERRSTNGTSKPQTALGLTQEARKTGRWVRVGNNELDYVAQDVTVRYFTSKPAPPRLGESHVEYIGGDVTVRYFTPKHAVVPPASVGNSSRPVATPLPAAERPSRR
jgi:hypothetical protein